VTLRENDAKESVLFTVLVCETESCEEDIGRNRYKHGDVDSKGGILQYMFMIEKKAESERGKRRGKGLRRSRNFDETPFFIRSHDILANGRSFEENSIRVGGRQ